MEISFALGKNRGYMPSSSVGRSISVGRQWDENFAIGQLQFGDF